MGQSHVYEELRTKIQPALVSKLEEFRLLGTDSVTEQQLWDFLVKKRWKKVKEEKNLYEIIQDVLSIKVSDFITYATIEEYKTNEFSFDDEKAWKELLK